MERKTKIERMCVGAVWIYILVVFGVGVVMAGVAISDLVKSNGEKENDGEEFDEFLEFLEEDDKPHPELHQKILEHISKNS